MLLGCNFLILGSQIILTNILVILITVQGESEGRAFSFFEGDVAVATEDSDDDAMNGRMNITSD